MEVRNGTERFQGNELDRINLFIVKIKSRTKQCVHDC